MTNHHGDVLERGGETSGASNPSLVSETDEARNDGLHPYSACPLGTPETCAFSPTLSMDTSGIGKGGSERTTVYACASCGHGVTRPPIADVAVLYEGRDSQDFQPADTGLGERIKRVAFSRQAKGILADVARKPMRVIDFACGSGLLTVSIARHLDPNARMIALDFHDTPPRDMEGVEYRSFETMPELVGCADLVTCFHTLEHDENPRELLARVASLLAPGGTLVAEVPNHQCIWARLLGPLWDNWYLPYHRVHFSGASLVGLAHHAGLEVVALRDVTVPSIGRTLARAVKRPNTSPFILAGAALHPAQWLLEKATARPSALRIVARKP